MTPREPSAMVAAVEAVVRRRLCITTPNDEFALAFAKDLIAAVLDHLPREAMIRAACNTSAPTVQRPCDYPKCGCGGQRGDSLAVIDAAIAAVRESIR